MHFKHHPRYLHGLLWQHVLSCQVFDKIKPSESKYAAIVSSIIEGYGHRSVKDWVCVWVCSYSHDLKPCSWLSFCYIMHINHQLSTSCDIKSVHLHLIANQCTMHVPMYERHN